MSLTTNASLEPICEEHLSIHLELSYLSPKVCKLKLHDYYFNFLDLAKISGID